MSSKVKAFIAVVGGLLLVGANAQKKIGFAPDYFPLERTTYCTRTFEWTVGLTGQVQSQIIGNLTVPYTSGPLSGSMFCGFYPGDPSLFVLQKDGGTVRTLMDGDHYPSTDCSLTAYPQGDLPWEDLYDGLFFERSSVPAVGVKKGLSECEVGGDVDDALWFRIQDVTLQGHVYTNALIVWSFDTGPFVPLNLGGKDVELGITPPTADNPEDEMHRAPTSFVIFAEGVGLIALGQIDEGGELVAMAELVSISCHDKAPVFDAFDIPGTQITSARGGNDSGDIVGHYALNSSTAYHGFLRDKKGEWTTLDYPGAAGTFARDINNRGDIVGFYRDAGNVAHGFLLRAGSYESIDVPGSLYSEAASINDLGDIVGVYYDAGFVMHGFLLRAGSFTTIDFPEAIWTSARGINNRGDVIGSYGPAGYAPDRGYLLTEESFIPIDVPGAQVTHARGINDNGVIAGSYYLDIGGEPLGFLLDKGAFQTIQVPCAEWTILFDVTNPGNPIGHFVENNGFVYGFSVAL